MVAGVIGWAILSSVAVADPGGIKQEPYPKTPVGPGHFQFKTAYATNAWYSESKWWTLTQNAGRAYAVLRLNDKPIRLEAMSWCNPDIGRSHKAAAKVDYRFTSGYTGAAYIKPLATVWGEVRTFIGPGKGGGGAKVTFTVTDLTSDQVLRNDTIHSAAPPAIIESLSKHQDPVTLIKGETIGAHEFIYLEAGHSYQATVKLWTECWTAGIQTVRVDYSRHAKDVIGNVQVRGIDLIQLESRGSVSDEWRRSRYDGQY